MPKSNKISNKIYLDHASATPVDETVLKIMQNVAKENFANAGAIHEEGVSSEKILSQNKEEVAQILGAHADEIVFTSGATESNNLAILGIVQKNNLHIVTTNIEHASVLETCKYLETKNVEVTYVPVEENGIVNPEKIRKALKKNTVLVSVMYANNEIGTIQSIKEIAKVIRNFNKVNSTKVLFHTDATQAMNYLPINVEKLGVDLLSLNSGKIYGPKGVGLLYVKRKTVIQKIMHGGEQEFNLRPGTENIPLVVGFTLALKITEKMKEKEVKRLTILRDYFFNKLNHSGILKNTRMIVNGSVVERLPNNVNITISKIPSDLLVIELSAKGIYASEKSACKSGDKKASHVIQALREGETEGSLRFSLGRSTTKKDIDYTIKTLEQILTKLSKWYT
ncbi:MAG: cysteine desulfurase [Candidatus Pacebacteria bacterium]|nr:cysteine desulfurase [Candidatus Paceibacterota bacterium]